MESDWQEVTRVAFPPPTPHGAAVPVSCCAFDNTQELIWAGNDYGRITSSYGSELQKYTSYRGHAQHEGPVKQILPCDRGVLSVSSRSLHFAEKRGRALWHLVHRDFRDLRCICYSSKAASQVLVAGCQPVLCVVNVDRGEIEHSQQSAEQYTMMKRGGQYICAATASGSVQLLDPKSLEVLKTWKAHMGWVNDMDANSSFLVTCGFSTRQHFGPVPDPLVKVFDLKTLMPLPPVQFHAGASLVRMHPRMLTTSIVASQSGQIQVVDIVNSTMVNVRQVNVVDSFLTSLEVAPSGEALALTDTLCWIHLWGSPSRMHFTDFSTPTEFADEADAPKTTIDWSGNTPLNAIGMPYYRETLLSAWPSHLIFEVGAPPSKIDPAILASLNRHADTSVAFAPNPRKLRRNQAVNTRSLENIREGLSDGPKFLSEKARDGDDDQGRHVSDAFGSLSVSNADGTQKVHVPKLYQNVEIQYSKFGVDDFDFGYFNNTKYSGLETHIANSYANPLLQLLRFTTWIRNLSLLHTAGECLFENCLLCELGFLIDMLEKANGQNCQATNFLKVFGGLSHVASMGLLEDGAPARPLTLMIQATNRFLLERFAADYRQTSSQAHMDKILATAAVNSIRCAHCGNETVRPGGTYVHELVYPIRPGASRGQLRNYAPTFSQILKASVERQDQTRGWCDRCKRYQQLHARKTIQAPPPVLTINTAIHSADARQLWAKPSWLPAEVGIIVEGGQLFCYEGQDLQLHIQRGAFQITVYELVGVVAEINSGETQNSHLVSMINVSPAMRENQPVNCWHLFNDFSVHEIPQEEALRFDASWKLPSVLTYQVKSARHAIDDSWKTKLNTDLLYQSSFLPAEDASKFLPLDRGQERPAPGFVVGIDAEFVMMQQEELQIKVDGSKTLMRPPRLALGRISVLRGGRLSADGQVSDLANKCLPFIDDYIQVTEPIVDHLTEFSGIRPGDLDPKTSRYVSSGRLVSLKLAYKKIWLLLNLGCVFVGHGLAKDFRTINIQVPKEQVIDTVMLFYDKSRARKLSLRFLTWYLLGELIQQEGGTADGLEALTDKPYDLQNTPAGHDSIVDAEMALRLWDKWREHEANDSTERVIEAIYRKGRELNFRPPSSSMTPASASQSGRATPLDHKPLAPVRPSGTFTGKTA